MSEPRYGYKNLIKTKKDGKVRAFFSLLIPTETAGTIELSGFKIIEGSNGLFVSLPNRAVKGNNQEIISAESGAVTMAEGTKYYNNIRFESPEKYTDFRKELNDNVLPLIVRQLSVV